MLGPEAARAHAQASEDVLDVEHTTAHRKSCRGTLRSSLIRNQPSPRKAMTIHDLNDILGRTASSPSHARPFEARGEILRMPDGRFPLMAIRQRHAMGRRRKLNTSVRSAFSTHPSVLNALLVAVCLLLR